MAARKCPLCHAGIPAAWTVARTDGFNCPNCGKLLEVSAGNRGVAVLAGAAAGYLEWRMSRSMTGSLAWALPVATTAVAFGVVAAIVQMLVADLVTRAEEPAPAPVDAGHGGGHGQATHH